MPKQTGKGKAKSAKPKAPRKPPKNPQEGAFFSPETAQTAHYKKPDDKEIIEALYECYGNVTMTAEKLDVSRRVVYDWFDEYPYLVTHKDKARRQAHDHVESKLMELVNGVIVQQMGPDGPRIYQRPPDKTSVIFFLKAQAGWVDTPRQDEEDEELTELEGLLATYLKAATVEHGASQSLPVQPGAVSVPDPQHSED